MLQIFERQYLATNCFLNLVFLVVYFLFCTNILLLKSFTTIVYVIFSHVWPNVYTKEDFEKIDLFRNEFSNIVFLKNRTFLVLHLNNVCYVRRKLKGDGFSNKRLELKCLLQKLFINLFVLSQTHLRGFSRKNKN